MIEHMTVLSAYDQIPLDLLIMAPFHPRAIVQISHGMCEHKERYLHFMNYLTNQGYVCCIHDHRGHGKSLKKKEDLGYLYPSSQIALIKDLHQLTIIMKTRYPHLPIYLLGHSMGSLTGFCYLKKYAQELNGMIALSNPSYLFLCQTGIRFITLYTKIKNDHDRIDSLQHLVSKILNRKYDHHIENSWICSNPDTVNKFNLDPLCHFTYSINGYDTLLKLMKMTYLDSWQHVSIPILYLAGQKDPCILSQKRYHQSLRLLKKKGFSQITNQLISNMQHELLHETNREMIYRLIVDQLNSWQKQKS